MANKLWSRDLNPSLFRGCVLLAPIQWCKPCSFVHFLVILLPTIMLLATFPWWCLALKLALLPTIPSIIHSFIHSTNTHILWQALRHKEECSINDSTYHDGLLWELNKLHKGFEQYMAHIKHSIMLPLKSLQIYWIPGKPPSTLFILFHPHNKL